MGSRITRPYCQLCDHEWTRHDPEDGMCDCPAENGIGACPCGRDLSWMQQRIAAKSKVALSASATSEGQERHG